MDPNTGPRSQDRQGTSQSPIASITAQSQDPSALADWALLPRDRKEEAGSPLLCQHSELLRHPRLSGPLPPAQLRDERNAQSRAARPGPWVLYPPGPGQVLTLR